MTDNHEIMGEIGRLLWSVFPEEAEVIITQGQLYPHVSQIGFKWVYKDGSSGSFNRDNFPTEIRDKIITQMKLLRDMEPYKNDPFSQFEAHLTNDKNLRMKFAFIPEEDSWQGLYMRRVSELSEEEAQQVFIPTEHWQAAVDKYKGDGTFRRK